MSQPHFTLQDGVPCIGVGRWPISHLLTALTFVETLEDALSVYPGVTKADVRHALDVAASVMQHPITGALITLVWSETFTEEAPEWGSLKALIDNRMKEVR